MHSCSNINKYLVDKVFGFQDDEVEVFSQNLSSTITGDIDTPEGFVMIPSNLDEFGQVVSRKSSDASCPSPNAGDSRTQYFSPGSSSPCENRTRKASHAVTNAVCNTPDSLSKTPPKASNLSPIDRHRIITESQGVKFIVGSPPHSPVPLGSQPSSNSKGGPGIHRSNSTSKQLYHPASNKSDSENSSNKHTGYYNNNIWNFTKTQTALSAEKIPRAIDFSAKLSRAVTFHHLDSGRNPADNVGGGMIAERNATNFPRNHIVPGSHKFSVPSSKYLKYCFQSNLSRRFINANGLSRAPDRCQKKICALCRIIYLKVCTIFTRRRLKAD